MPVLRLREADRCRLPEVRARRRDFEGRGRSRRHKPLSEHDSFDSAYEAACKLFDDGVWDDFLIDDGGHLTSLPGYRLVKETCPKCGKETRPFEMYGTRDYYGIPFRRVCARCYEHIMTTTGYDGGKYDERDENLDADY